MTVAAICCPPFFDGKESRRSKRERHFAEFKVKIAPEALNGDEPVLGGFHACPQREARRPVTAGYSRKCCLIPLANGPDAFVDFHMVQVPVHFHRRMEVLMTVAITRTDLTSRELHAAGSRSHDARAARRMVAVALVPESADRKSAASSCGMDRRALRDWLHRYNEEGLAARRGVTHSSTRRRRPRLSAQAPVRKRTVLSAGGAAVCNARSKGAWV